MDDNSRTCSLQINLWKNFGLAQNTSVIPALPTYFFNICSKVYTIFPINLKQSHKPFSWRKELPYVQIESIAVIGKSSSVSDLHAAYAVDFINWLTLNKTGMNCLNVLWGQKLRMASINRSPRWSFCESGAVALLQRPAAPATVTASHIRISVTTCQQKSQILLKQGQLEAFPGVWIPSTCRWKGRETWAAKSL